MKTIKREVDVSKFYSLSIDTSSFFEYRLLPILVRVFSFQRGVRYYLLKIENLPYENSNIIENLIMNNLKAHALDIKNCTSFSADSASINFGSKNGIFKKLQKHNENIIPSRCSCHLLDNLSKCVYNSLSIDIHGLVSNIYSYFNRSPKNVDILKKIFDEFRLEFKKVLKNVPTRWLSLNKYLGRKLDNYIVLKHFFKNKIDELSQIMKNFFGLSNASNNDNMTNYSIALICSVYDFSCVIESKIESLEKNKTTILEAHFICLQVLEYMEACIEYKQFGKGAEEKIKSLSETKKDQFETEVLEFMNKLKNYFKERYNNSINNFFNQALHFLPGNVSQLKWENLKKINMLVKFLNLNENFLLENFIRIKSLLIEKSSTSFIEFWTNLLHNHSLGLVSENYRVFCFKRRNRTSF